jgi:peptide/nickel transport system permease protein
MTRERSLVWLARRLGRDVPATLGAAVILLLLVVSVEPRWFTTHDPYRLDPVNRLRAPSATYPLGTDEMGRDIYTRIVYGARLTLGAAVLAVGLAALAGGTVGLLAGYVSGWVDEVVMRATDIFLAFPPLVLAMAIVAALGQDLVNSVVGLAGIWWAQYARLMRSRALEIKAQEYVLSARATGLGHARILVRHVAPNGLAPLLVKVSIDMGLVVIMLSALSFMGLGAKPPVPEWGAMITTGRRYLLDYWWVPTFPGFAIFVSVLAFNVVGDWIRDVTDPRAAV